jgi:hypothetical protein
LGKWFCFILLNTAVTAQRGFPALGGGGDIRRPCCTLSQVPVCTRPLLAPQFQQHSDGLLLWVNSAGTLTYLPREGIKHYSGRGDQEGCCQRPVLETRGHLSSQPHGETQVGVQASLGVKRDPISKITNREGAAPWRSVCVASTRS